MITIVLAAIALIPQDFSQDSTLKPWELVAFQSLDEKGVLMDGLLVDGNKWAAFSRWVAAVSVSASTRYMQQVCDGLDQEVLASHGRYTPKVIRCLQQIETWRGDLVSFKVLAPEFSTEYRELGGKPADVLDRISSLQNSLDKFAKEIPQFSDVPKGHWAAEATLELRQAGILEGYPDGHFDRK